MSTAVCAALPDANYECDEPFAAMLSVSRAALSACLVLSAIIGNAGVPAAAETGAIRRRTWSNPGGRLTGCRRTP
jgi:hypothetical protein